MEREVPISRGGTRVVDPPGDEALAAAVRDDPRAFEALYVRHRASVYRYLRSRVRDDDLAADLTATTFERALVAIGRYRPMGGGFLAWLFRIARNAAIDADRRGARLAPADLARLPARPGPEVDAVAAERLAELRARVADLPDLQREAIVLRYAARLTAREIGGVIGKSEAATQKVLTRALAALKETYRDRE